MKKLFSIGLMGMFISLLIIMSCEKPKAFSTTPEIAFKSFSIADSIDVSTPTNSKKVLVLTFKVTDGDGDIGIFGYNDGDSNNIYPGFEDLGNKDLFTTLYEKKNGVFQEVPLAYQNNFSIPYTEPVGQDKTLIADIQVKMEIAFPYYTYDTIKYSFYIYDRKLHQSNIAETPEIPADTIGTIQ
jgi:hypothetical protein